MGAGDVEGLHETPLRELGVDPILLVAGNAPFGLMGDINYFRYFLPRAVELAVRGEIWSHFIEAGVSGSLRESDPAQRAAILAVLDAWWSDILSTWPSETSVDDFLSLIDQCELPLRPYLDAWAAHGTTSAAHHLAYYARTLVFSDSTVERDAWLASGDASALIRGVPPQAGFDRALDILDALESEAAAAASK
jgi:hypothetical protein